MQVQIITWVAEDCLEPDKGLGQTLYGEEWDDSKSYDEIEEGEESVSYPLRLLRSFRPSCFPPLSETANGSAGCFSTNFIYFNVSKWSRIRWNIPRICSTKTEGLPKNSRIEFKSAGNVRRSSEKLWKATSPSFLKRKSGSSPRTTWASPQKRSCFSTVGEIRMRVTFFASGGTRAAKKASCPQPGRGVGVIIGGFAGPEAGVPVSPPVWDHEGTGIHEGCKDSPAPVWRRVLDRFLGEMKTTTVLQVQTNNPPSEDIRLSTKGTSENKQSKPRMSGSLPILIVTGLPREERRIEVYVGRPV